MKNLFLSLMIGLTLLGTSSFLFIPTKAHARAAPGAGGLNEIYNPGSGTTAQTTPTPASKPICGDIFFGSGLNLDVCINDGLAILGDSLLAFVSLFVKLGGEILDLSISFSIVQFKNITDQPGIREGWSVLRDFANMFFIFILLYAAISTVLGKDVRGIVKNVIIAALLINFSFFITSVFIDISNTLTVGIYNQILALGLGGTGGNISDAFMRALGISGTYGANIQELSGPGLSATMLITRVTIAGSIFMGVTAFVFFAAAVLFLLRTGMLFFLLLLSPLAFAAAALPRDEYSGRWWKSLTNNMIFPPAYMIMVYASLKIITALKTGLFQSGGDFSQNLGTALAKGEAGEPVLNFIVLIILMISSLIIAKNFGASGSGTVMKWGKNLRTGVQGFAGRNTFGRAGSYFERKMDEKGIGSSRLGQFTRTYTTGAMAGAKFGSNASRKDMVAKEEGREKERENRTRVANRHAAFTTGTRSGATTTDINKMGDEIKKMSAKDLENLDFNTLNHPEVMLKLSSSQMKSVRESEKLTQKQKDTLGKTRDAAFSSKTSNPLAVDELLKGKPNEIAKYPAKFLKDPAVASKLGSPILSAIKNEREMSSADMGEIRDHIENTYSLTGPAGSPTGPSKQLTAVITWLTNNPDFGN